MTTPDNSATEKPWDVQQHGNLFCVRGPSAIPNCTEESYWYEHEQRAQWLCDALNLAAALHSANEKLRGECEELRERVAAYEHAATAVMRERPGCRCNIEDCEAGQCSQCLLMEATDYMDEAARAAEGGEDDG